MNLTASFVCHLITGEKYTLAEFISQNTAINAMAGIGAPERFFTTLTDLNFELNHRKGFVDHYDFILNDFDCFDDKLPLMMTEKDAVKCQSFAQKNWWYLPVDAIVSTDQLEQLKTKIKQL